MPSEWNYYDFPQLGEILEVIAKSGPLPWWAKADGSLDKEALEKILAPLGVALISGVHLTDNPRSAGEIEEHRDHERDARGG